MTRDAVENLLDFAADLRWSDVPGPARRALIDHTADGLGVMVAGARAETVPEVSDLVRVWGSGGTVRIPGSPLRVGVPAAALLAGTMVRALDFDDVHEGAFVHPTASVLPVALILAQMVPDGSGERLATALCAGMEVTVRLGLAPSASPTDSGMSHNNQAGLLGGVIAGGLVLGFDREPLANACGIAYGMVGGNLQPLVEGTSSIRVQQGVVAMNAVIATLLAGQGIAGPRQILDGRYGYFNTYHGGSYDREVIRDGLGERFELIRTSFKPYAAAKPVHPAIEAALRLRASLGADLDVERVDVHVNRFTASIAGEPIERKQRPRSASEMQFSIPWGFAAAFLFGRAGPAEFSRAAGESEDCQRLAGRVFVDVPPSGMDRGEAPSGMGGARVVLRTTDGRVHAVDVPRVSGQPESPLEEADHRRKFVDCYLYAGHGHELAEADFATATRLDEILDVRSWVEQVADSSRSGQKIDRPAAGVPGDGGPSEGQSAPDTSTKRNS